MSTIGRLGGVYALLDAGNAIGDFWVQAPAQAAAKGDPGWPGRLACVRHVATLTATQGLFLAAGAFAARERLDGRRVAMGLAVNAATHYWADRRTPLRWLATRTGRASFYDLGAPADGCSPCLGTGAYALDQAFHRGMLAVAAVIICGREKD